MADSSIIFSRVDIRSRNERMGEIRERGEFFQEHATINYFYFMLKMYNLNRLENSDDSISKKKERKKEKNVNFCDENIRRKEVEIEILDGKEEILTIFVPRSFSWKDRRGCKSEKEERKKKVWKKS